MVAQKQNVNPAHSTSISTWLKSLPLLVLAISLVTTILMWHMIDDGFKQEANHDFKDKAYEIAFQLNEVLRDHEQVLRGGVGLFNATNDVTREQWHRYVSTQQFNRIHPGITGVGYAAWLKPEDISSHTRKARNDGFPEYRVWPEGERPSYAAITLLEPSTWPYLRAIGYDMESEAIRRTALDRAGSKGLTTITGKVSLVSESGKEQEPGIVMYLPVYRQGMPVITKEQRLAALKGYVFSPIKVKEFVYGSLGTLPTDIAFDISDGETTTLLFNSLKSEKVSLPANYRPYLTTTHKIDVYGRTWKVSFKSLPTFNQEFHENTSRLALFSGMLLSFLLAAISYSLLSTRNRALALAQGMTQELRESEETVRLILDTAGEAIYGVDSDCFCTFCNPAGLALLGYRTEEELLGKNMHDMLHDTREDGSVFPCGECTIKRVMTTATGCHVDDAQFRRSDGSNFPAEYWAMPKCKDGQVIGAVVSFMDIIERKRNEAAVKEQSEQLRQEVAERREAQKALLHYQHRLEAMNEALEERVAEEVKTSRAKDQALMQQDKMASIGQLAAGVAHEINTPMAFITSNLCVLSKYFDQIVREREQGSDPSPPPAGRKKPLRMEQILADGIELIAESLDGAERVTTIVRDLKSFSRVDVPEYERLDMTSCLESALNVAHNEINNRATVRKEFQLLPAIYCHPGQLNQLFLNLLKNACQAIEPPGEIVLRSWHDEAFVYASVSDNGQGIPEEIRGKIIDPFFTTRDVGAGTGMGLSIAFEIVKNHDGSLLLESEVGKGTTFTVVLPLTREEPA
jgi:two-component system, cell cycle sensor histidine kinase and response regulator CckA